MQFLRPNAEDAQSKRIETSDRDQKRSRGRGGKKAFTRAEAARGKGKKTSARARVVARIAQERGVVTRSQRCRFIWSFIAVIFSILAVVTCIRTFLSVQRSDKLVTTNSKSLRGHSSDEEIPEIAVPQTMTSSISVVPNAQSPIKQEVKDEEKKEVKQEVKDEEQKEVKQEVKDEVKKEPHAPWRKTFPDTPIQKEPPVDWDDNNPTTTEKSEVVSESYEKRAEEMIKILKSRGYAFLSNVQSAQGSSKPAVSIPIPTKDVSPSSKKSKKPSAPKKGLSAIAKKERHGKKAVEQEEDEDLYCKRKELACRKSTGRCYFKASCTGGLVLGKKTVN